MLSGFRRLALISCRPSFSADWGDYLSFAHHLRQRADAEGRDLLLIDTGDRIEGNGLYDASEPKGKYLFDIVKQQNIDLVCSGNHELYKVNSSENELHFTVPNFENNYIASNLDIVNPDTGDFQPLAPRFKKFATKNLGIRILTFGFIFDFTGNANNTRVQPVEETIKEEWFQKAIRDKDLDLILIFGHVAIRSKEYDGLFNAIRSVKWDLPIQFFGGHTHIRDFKVYDKISTAMESGRYLETIGFLSIDGLPTHAYTKKGVKSDTAGLTFSRRYIDNNLFSFYQHSGKGVDDFDTSHGQNVSRMITDARSKMDLDKVIGCVPRDLWMNRAPFPSQSSIFSWLQTDVFPNQLKKSARAAGGNNALVISNTGAVRFDMFKGPFTKDSTFLVSPFTSGFRFLKGVPYKTAKQVIALLNHQGPMHWSEPRSRQLQSLTSPEQKSIQEQRTATNGGSYRQTHLNFDQQFLGSAGNDSDLTPGYTTVDDAGDDGDDTAHSRISFYNVPSCFEAAVGFDPAQPDPPELVDLAYNEFVEDYILLALRYLGKNYDKGDTGLYLEATLTSVIADWIKENWAPPEEGGKCSE